MRTFDILTRDVLAATASSYTCQYGAVTATDLSVKDIRTVVKTLMENDGRPFNAMQEGVNKFGTAPLPETFWALASVSIMDDLEDLRGWTKKSEYPSPKGLHAAEFGAIGYTRWMLSSLGYYNSDTGFFSAFVLAKNCYITVDLTGNITTHFKDFGSAGTDDPLDQLATHGYVLAHVKSSLIDLEAYGESYGDRGQAFKEAA